jgi:phosphatidylinositol glycan class M
MALVYLAHIIDTTSTSAKYTDTDYDVFTDAATLVYNGRSPYERHTYRYTPLVAYMSTINNVTHYVASKIIFCIIDIIMGYIIWELLDVQNENKSKNIYYVAFLLLNPASFIMSTRGSNDCVITLLVLAALYFILKR